MGKFLLNLYVAPLENILFYMVLAVVGWAAVMVLLAEKPWGRLLNLPLLAVGLYGILRLTLLRTPGTTPVVHLQPFHILSPEGFNDESYRTLLMNVFLFLPLGLSLPYLLPRKLPCKPLFTALVGLCLSVGVEIAQYHWCLGSCETDDVMMNTLGTVIGTLCFWLYRQVTQKQRRTH